MRKDGNSEELIIYLDENMPVAVSEGLKRRGMNAFSARDAGNRGFSDLEQLKFAASRKAVIVTNDADFLRMVKKSSTEHFGIIYYEQDKYTIGEVIRKIEDLTTILTKEDFRNHIEFL